MRASRGYTNHVKRYNDDKDELNGSDRISTGIKKANTHTHTSKALPRLLSLFLMFVVDDQPDSIVGDETGKCAWNVGTLESDCSNVINSSDRPAAESGVTDDERFSDDLILSNSSNWMGASWEKKSQGERKRGMKIGSVKTINSFIQR